MQTPRGRNIFCSNCAKPPINPNTVALEVTNNKDSRNRYGVTNAADEDGATTPYPVDHWSFEGKQKNTKASSAVINSSKQFDKSEEEEIQGLI